MPEHRTRAPRPLWTAICEHCHRAYQTVVWRGRFCSTSCRMKAQYGSLSDRLWSKIEKDPTPGACWTRPGKPHERWKLRETDGAHKVYAARVALEEALGHPIPDGLQALHTCDVEGCVRNDEPGVYVLRGVSYPRFGHLWLGTLHDNHADKADKRRGPYGEGVVIGTLTDATVRQIRERLAAGATQRAVAREYGVSHTSVRWIAIGKTWKHLD